MSILFSIRTPDYHQLIDLLINNRISFEVHSNPPPEAIKEQNQSIDSSDNTICGISEELLTQLYEQHILQDVSKPLISLNVLAKELNLSATKLRMAFVSKYGKPFYQLHIDKKMEFAICLLKKGYKGCEVSKMVGYGDKSDIKFNKMFQKHFGVTPKKYQLANTVYINKRAQQRYDAIKTSQK